MMIHRALKTRIIGFVYQLQQTLFFHFNCISVMFLRLSRCNFLMSRVVIACFVTLCCSYNLFCSFEIQEIQQMTLFNLICPCRYKNAKNLCRQRKSDFMPK